MNMKYLIVMILLVSSMMARTATVNFAWDANSETNIAGYRIYTGVSSRSYSVSNDFGNVTSGNLSGLNNSSRYYHALTAFNTSGLESFFSAEVVALTPVPVVSGFMASGVTDNSVTLVWNAPANNIQRYFIAHSTNLTILGTNSTAAQTITINNLRLATTYNFFITASNEFGVTSFSVTTVASTLARPEPPTGFRILTILQGNDKMSGPWTNLAIYEYRAPTDQRMKLYRTSHVIEPPAAMPEAANTKKNSMAKMTPPPLPFRGDK